MNPLRRRVRHLSGGLLLAAASLLLAPAAHAATVTVSNFDGGADEGVFVGGDDTINELIISDPSATTIRVQAVVGTIAPGGPGCSTIIANVVDCTVDTLAAEVAAGGEDDVVKLDDAATVRARLYGGPGDDELRGGAVADQLSGEGGLDRLYGRAGDDDLRGDDDADRLDGQEGSDLVIGGLGSDIFEDTGSVGTDSVTYKVDSVTSGVRLSVGDGANDGRNGGAEGDDVRAGFERLQGSNFGDVLRGGPAGETINGSGGDDDIDGGAGADTIEGNGGDDVIRAQDGAADARLDCDAASDPAPSHGTADVALIDAVDPEPARCETVTRPGGAEEPPFVPAPPSLYSGPPAPLWRIQGIEVTQGTQFPGVQETNQAGGFPTVNYNGVKLAQGGVTFARVFVDTRADIVPTLKGYSGGRELGTIRPSALIWRSVETGSASAGAKQQSWNGGYQFELPASWVRSRLRLTAHIDGGSVKCDVPACRDASLDGIVFTPVRPIKVRFVALLDDKQYPPKARAAVLRAFQLVPQDRTNAIQIPQFYAGALEVGDLKSGSSTKCTFWWFCEFRTREDANSATLERLQDWDEANPPKNRADIDLTIGISGDPDIGLSNAASVFPWHGGSQLCSIGGIGSAFLCTRPVIAVSEATSTPNTSGRPLTNLGHELFHALGRPHASKACGGGGGGLNLMGEDWPPDQKGYLNGVGFDYGEGMDRTGLNTPWLSNFMPMYRVVPQEVSTGYTAHADVGQTTKTFDLMSYCGGAGSGDRNFWLSPHNWDGTLERLSTGRAVRALTARAAGIRAFSAASGRRMEVNAVQTGEHTTLTTMEEVSGRTAVVADPGAVPHVVFRDAAGAKVSDTPMEALRTHVDSAGAVPLTMLRALTPMPPSGVRSVSIEQDGQPVSTRERSRNAPTVRFLAPRSGGRFAKGKRFTVRWKAADRDGGALFATLDYAADGRRFRTIWSGPDSGRATLDSSMLGAGRRARFRLTMDDGFNRGTARSKRFRVSPRAPLVVIDDVPPKRRVGAAQTFTLRGGATQPGGTAVDPSRLRWYLGKRRIGRGASVSVTAPAKGRMKLRLVARGSTGPAGTRRLTLTVVPAA